MPRLERGRWEDAAACAVEGVDPDVFFEVEDAADAGRVASATRIASALTLCAGCDLSEECFRRAVYSRSLGIWGGTTAEERGVRYRVKEPL